MNLQNWIEHNINSKSRLPEMNLKWNVAFATLWKPPDMGCVKLNVDGSARGAPGSAAQLPEIGCSDFLGKFGRVLHSLQKSKKSLMDFKWPGVRDVKI